MRIKKTGHVYQVRIEGKEPAEVYNFSTYPTAIYFHTLMKNVHLGTTVTLIKITRYGEK